MNKLIIYFLFVHWIGDFILQSREVANNKSKDFGALIVHSAIYFYTFWFACFPGFIETLGCRIIDFPIFCLINGLSHLIIDFFTSKINAYLWSKQRIHGFFTCIGFDQFLHITILIVTLQIYVK